MIHAPAGLFLNEENGLMPDIMVIHNDNKDIIKEKGIYGVPDWIIEVLSPGNRKNDLIDKRDVYHKNEVKEYWCIDTEINQVHVFLLEDDYDEKLVKMENTDTITTKIFDITMKMKDIFNTN